METIRPTVMHRLPRWARGLLCASLLASATSAADPAVVASPLATKGKEVRDYEVTGIEPDGLRIQHGTRTDKNPFERVPRELWPVFNRDFREVERHAGRWREFEDDAAAQWRDY